MIKSWLALFLSTKERIECDEDFLFRSVVKNGTNPITPDMILKRHIRPALKRMRQSNTPVLVEWIGDLLGA